jgi:hypothetical protein
MSLPSVPVVVRPGGGWQLLILSLVILTGCNKVEPAKSINQEEVPQDAIQLLFYLRIRKRRLGTDGDSGL